MNKYIEKLKNPKGPLTKKMILLFTLSMIACIAVFVMVFFFVNSNNYVFNGQGQMYSGGSAATLQQGTKLKKSITGETVITSGSSEIENSSSFVYLTTKNGVVLTENMIYYSEATNTFSKVDYFTEVYYGGDTWYATRGNKTITLDSGYLYDGKDTYLLLCATTLSVAGSEYQLAELAHIEARYQEDVIIYENSSKAITLIEFATQNCKAEAQSGFSIDMFYDMMTSAEGENAMVVSDFSLLTSVFKN